MVLLLLFEQELIEKIRFEVTEGEICWDTLYRDNVHTLVALSIKKVSLRRLMKTPPNL